MKILVLGQSHSIALKQAYIKKDSAFHQQSSFQFVPIADRRYRGVFFETSTVANQEIKTELIQSLYNADLIIFSLLGDAHTQLGLINHPLPYDLILDDNENHTIETNTQYIPKSAIKEKIKISTKLFTTYAKTLIDLAPSATPIIQIQSPPLIGSKEHILKHPSGFAEKIEKYGISPPLMRKNLYSLHSEVIREYCVELGIGYLLSPEEAKDNLGFLKQEYWATDPSHANAGYGSLVLAQILTECRELLD